MKRTIPLAVALLVAVSASGGQFRPASSPPAGLSRYRVTIAETVVEPIESVATELARTYGGRLEVYAEEGFHGFMIAIMPERAELLSRDTRVVLVEEIPRSGATVPPPRPPARVATAAAPVRAVIKPNLLVPANPPWDSGEFSYDGAGNITAMGTNDRFSYDAVSRLTSATVSGKTQTYTYDAFGNMTHADPLTEKCAGGTDCAYSPTIDSHTNRIAGSSSCTDNDGNSMCYDAAGNLTRLDLVHTFTWDALSVMTSRTDAVGGPSITREFIYDANDERIGTYVNGNWSWTIRDIGNHILSEYTSTGTTGTTNWQWQRDHIYRGSALVAAISAAGPTFHYHLDHLGTPRLITSAGKQIALHTYLPFGAELSTPPVESPAEVLKFTGHEFDDLGGDIHSTYYMHARSESAMMARFLSVDPVFGAPQRPQSWNRYAYVANNPLNISDPTGKILQCANNITQCKADLNQLAPGTRVPASGTVQKASLVRRIVNHLTGHGRGTALVSRLIDSPTVVPINPQHDPQGGTSASHTITYDPAGVKGVLVRDANGNITTGNVSGAAVLGHELVHEDHAQRGTQDHSIVRHVFTNHGSRFAEFGESEEFRTVGFSPFVQPGDITENQLNREMGQPERATYLTNPALFFQLP